MDTEPVENGEWRRVSSQIMTMDEQPAKSRQGSGGTQLLLLMLVFGLPVIFAWLLYFNPNFLPGGRSNQGELIQPVRPLPDQLYTTINGDSLSRAQFEGYWTLLFSAGANCDEPCQQRIYDMRQIRKAMAEHHGTIQRMVVIDRSGADQKLRNYLQQYQGTTVLVGDHTSLQPLRQQLAVENGSSVDRLYLVDPMGNLMMQYTLEQPSSAVLSDLELLLKVNRWGGGH